ncbi:MAG: nitroreductase family deazaflavin-dependent oxidoreductase [Anaerolineales bacterium]|jgi:deazaflavin-dependent oxidoreductase (nitroreductase family)
MSSTNDWNKKIIQEFRANDGKVGGPFEGMTLLLLHTTGARSGAARVNPVATMQDGDDYIIIASKGGAPSNPDWYYNLVAHPVVKVEVGTEEFTALAEVTQEPERSQLYDKMAGLYPGFADYAQKTERVIPVIRLEPQS